MLVLLKAKSGKAVQVFLGFFFSINIGYLFLDFRGKHKSSRTSSWDCNGIKDFAGGEGMLYFNGILETVVKCWRKAKCLYSRNKPVQNPTLCSQILALHSFDTVCEPWIENHLTIFKHVLKRVPSQTKPIPFTVVVDSQQQKYQQQQQQCRSLLFSYYMAGSGSFLIAIFLTSRKETKNQETRPDFSTGFLVLSI